MTMREPIPKKSLVIKTDKPRPNICPVCSRGFVRLEHLKRHQRSHTREKPYLCVFCGRCFARKDLVLRHQGKLHPEVLSALGPTADIKPVSLEELYAPGFVAESNVVRISGNKETLLEIPALTQPLQLLQRQRRSSFSAANESSYTKSVSVGDTSQTTSFAPVSQRESLRPTPENVGQLNVLDSADPVESQPAFLGGPTLVPTSSHTVRSMSQPMDDAVLPSKNNGLTQSYLFLSNLPSLTDLLSLDNSSAAHNATNNSGESLFIKKGALGRANLSPFEYKVNNLPPPPAFPPPDVLTTRKTPLSMFTNVRDLRDEDPLDDKWLNKFLDENSVDLANKKLNENFNEIGFYISSSSSSSVSSAQGSNHSSSASSPNGEQLEIKPNPRLRYKLSHGISDYFTQRQMHLHKHSSKGQDGDLPAIDETEGASYKTDAKIKVPLSLPCSYFTQELRSYIIEENRLSSNAFPTVDQLNEYVHLYKMYFHRFLPFIHFPSIRINNENYPLLLSFAMIGALYGYHSSHTKILLTVTNNQVKMNLERIAPTLNAPLWVIQTMLLMTFIGVFNNDLKIMKNMNTHLMTLIQLISVNKINLPLEFSVQPPSPSSPPAEQFEYFTLAQERIRLCHSLLLISNMFASLVGFQLFFHSIDLKCGVPTVHEDLFQCSSWESWSDLLREKRIVLDSKFSLIQLSNGDITYESCLVFLTGTENSVKQNGNFLTETRLPQVKLSKFTLLSLITSIHEKIYMERNNIIAKISVQTPMLPITREQLERDWFTNSRPIINTMIKNWEILHFRNGGFVEINEQTIPIIDATPAIRLILPLYLFTKIKMSVDLTYVMNRIWMKDWAMMNKTLDEVSYNWAALQDATSSSIHIVNSWISIVNMVQPLNGEDGNSQIGGYWTPITTITCMFASISVLAEYLKKLEDWAMGRDMQQGIVINSRDKELYSMAAKTLRQIQKVLLPQHDSMKSYLEFLQLQTSQHITALDDVDNEPELLYAMSPAATIEQTAAAIRKLKLSSRTLYLGVRILGDTPVWPIAMVFAHALQSRAVFNVSEGHNV
ncbi:Rsf2p KNAG_0B06710 [Huiozyma naganishii CBS 8797]|uniref:C2H2-type domain-containing protein n=1 Tax=Huiozyma naganishii (strain ATCC MYA-139 / BCRC 22969 / CBS 8797 / KCTC 17520 / NBRC 10181 / NCYC 3082 / Yp74L-3) TaxID=1071383 RepID=J7S5E4_HUIN7|nr:hypothetical protein KNAG_0B06710 [Kazachstania naganishii CBS 8797]CCK69096.1 hypothetical protein KNAG_0B06710 [Kazachstania naganishii CBS 8797]